MPVRMICKLSEINLQNLPNLRFTTCLLKPVEHI